MLCIVTNVIANVVASCRVFHSWFVALSFFGPSLRVSDRLVSFALFIYCFLSMAFLFYLLSFGHAVFWVFVGVCFVCVGVIAYVTLSGVL